MNVKLLSTYIIFALLLNVGCDRRPIKIKDYTELNEGDYLVVFKEKFPFGTDNYKVTVTNFEDKERFYVTFDQHNIFFDIKDYDSIQSKNDTIFVYTNYEPEIRIEEKRSYAFEFVEVSK